jgi:hypothetical protein
MQALYKFLVATMLGMLAQASLAQTGTLSGTLQDEKALALPYANVAVLRAADSTLATGTVTDGKGAFKIAPPISTN